MTSPLLETALWKRCKYCLVEKPVTSFEVCKVVRGTPDRRHRCRDCKQQSSNDRRDRMRTWADALKKSLRCQHCGFADYRALQFHHRGDGDQDAKVADRIPQGYSQAAILLEIARRIVLGANCHAIERHNDQT